MVRGRERVRTTAIVPLILLGMLLAGCSAPSDPAPSPVPTEEPRPAPPAYTGVDLLGTWTLTDASDDMSASITFWGDGRWEADYECGFVGGQWLAAETTFFAVKASWSMACSDNIDPQPALTWIDSATGLTRADGGWVILDSAGGATASLRDHAPLPSQSPDFPMHQDAPYLVDVVPLPTELEVRTLEGRWTPLVSKPGRSYLEFSGETWTASDGCNGAGGKWVDLGDGYVLATPSGGMTAMGCENVPVAYWVDAMRTAGFDGDELVLFDAAGDELGRLRSAH